MVSGCGTAVLGTVAFVVLQMKSTTDSVNPLMSSVTSTVVSWNVLKTASCSAECGVTSDWPDHFLTSRVTGSMCCSLFVYSARWSSRMWVEIQPCSRFCMVCSNDPECLFPLWRSQHVDWSQESPPVLRWMQRWTRKWSMFDSSMFTLMFTFENLIQRGSRVGRRRVYKVVSWPFPYPDECLLVICYHCPYN